jgi:membrane protease YdiL (CAAX protease family)
MTIKDTLSRFEIGTRVRHWTIALLGVAASVATTGLFGLLDEVFLPAPTRIVVTIAADSEDPAALASRFERGMAPEFVGSDTRIDATKTPIAACGEHPVTLSTKILLTASRMKAAMDRSVDVARSMGVRVCSNGYQTAEGRSASVSFVGTAITAALIMTLLWQRRRRPAVAEWLPWDDRLPVARALGLGLLAGVGLTVTMLGMLLVVARLIGGPSTAALTAEAPTVSTALVALLFAPVVEEFTFRAWFISHARQAVGGTMAVVLSASMFMAIHAPATGHAAIPVAMAGIALGGLWLRFQSLTVCVVAHAVWNATVVVATVLAAQG